MTREPVMPAARAALFTAVCVGLAVAAHRAMSGFAIPPWSLLVGGGAVYTLARIGARRERGLVEITLLMGALQVVLHLLFAYAHAHAGAASAAGGMSMPGMAMPAGSSMPMPGMAMGAVSSSSGLHTGTTGMVLGHALAALICAWWLRRGEAALHALAQGAALWIGRRFAVPDRPRELAAAVGARFIPRAEPVALALRSQWLRSTRALRGPPASPSFT